MFNAITKFMDEKLSTPMAKLAEQRHLRAIRDGIIATLPLIIVSSMFMVIAFLPNSMPQDWGITQFIAENQTKILMPYRVSMYIMTLYAVFGIGYSLANSYDLDGLSGGILAELAFLLTIIPSSIPAQTEAIASLASQNAELANYLSAVPTGFVLPMTNLGSAGMFIGIIVSFFAVEVYRFTQKSGFKISMPPQVPSSVARSFEALTPTAIVLLAVATVTMFIGIDVHGIISKIISPLIRATDSLPSVLLIIFITQFFWSFGIHGWSIVGSLARPLWLVLLEENTTNFAAHAAVTNVAAEPFYQWFVMIGGSGATIGLAILFAIRSRSAYGKALGKTAIVPAIFNINEPMIFGAPIVLNPMLIIPFIIAPMLNGLIAWFATTMGLVNNVVASSPWTLPGPIGAFLACGNDWRAAVLSIVLIILSILIYYPFFKDIGADGLRLDMGFTGNEEAIMTFNPYDLKIEINMSNDVHTIDTIMDYKPNRYNLYACHNFYPHGYTGLGLEFFENCTKRFSKYGLRTAAFVTSQNKDTFGSWPVTEGLPTLEMHRHLPMDVQIKHFIAMDSIDDILISNCYPTDEEIDKVKGLDLSLLTLDVELYKDTPEIEQKILFEELHFNRGDQNENMIRSTQSRVKYKGHHFALFHAPEIIRRGDVIIESSEYGHYAGELQIALHDMKNSGKTNVVGHIRKEEHFLLDYIKPWQKFRLRKVK